MKNEERRMKNLRFKLYRTQRRGGAKKMKNEERRMKN